MGRKKLEITPEHVQQVEALAGYGLTEAAIAHALGMSARTFRRRKNGAALNGNKEIVAALERGRALAEAQVGKALFHRCLSGDVQAIRWYEMTRLGRTEKQAVEHSGEIKSGVMEVPVPLEPTQWDEIARTQQGTVGFIREERE